MEVALGVGEAPPRLGLAVGVCVREKVGLGVEEGDARAPLGDGGGEAVRVCPKCKEGRLGLKLSYVGAFLGCSRHPECGATMAFQELLARGLAEPLEGAPCLPACRVY